MTRMVTADPGWARAATWSALAVVVVVIAVVVAELAAWRTLPPHGPARHDGAVPVMLHLAALWPLALGVVERFDMLDAVSRAHALGTIDLTRSFGAVEHAHALGGVAAPGVAFLWPFALAVAGAVAWLVGDWAADLPRRWTAASPRDARYQPTGLPSRA